MNSSEHWRNLFENWPQAIPRRGLLITTFNESISFVDFLISGGIVPLERDRPDSLGARKVFVAYDAISALKVTDVIDLVRFQTMGFQPPQ